MGAHPITAVTHLYLYTNDNGNDTYTFPVRRLGISLVVIMPKFNMCGSRVAQPTELPCGTATRVPGRVSAIRRRRTPIYTVSRAFHSLIHSQPRKLLKTVVMWD
jgi:hypothetical protein